MYTNLIYGIESTPGWFQREMENLLSVFFDDIHIQGRIQAAHDEPFSYCLTRLQNAGLTLSLDKCEINQFKVKFLGYVIDRLQSATIL